MQIQVVQSSIHANEQLIDLVLTRDELLKLVEFSLKPERYNMSISDKEEKGTLVRVRVQTL